MGSKSEENRIGEYAALSFATLAVLAALFWADIHFRANFNASVAYPTMLLVCLRVRSRRLLWTLTGLMIVLNVAAPALEATDSRAWLHRVVAILTTFVTAGTLHILFGTAKAAHAARAEAEARSIELARVNEELSAREHEIATQNEELRSQTEELERQGEELRVTNDELARRERTLESLLRLSRSLTAEMSRSDTLDRICQALSEMINGPGLGVGVKLKEGNHLRLLCHYGFGPAGPSAELLPFDRSFARLVLERNQTGYLEDISLRPDVMTPQPKEGEQFRSILAAPLRINGHAVGTLEAYSRERKNWSDEQIGMIESLAAQTSISLQAAELFDRVNAERRRFETIFRTLPIGVSVLSHGSNKIVNNPEAVLMLGLPTETDITHRMELAKYRIFRDHIELSIDRSPLLRAVGGEEVHGEELELLFPSKRMTVLASAAPIRAPDATVEGAVVAFTDVTALKRLQSELDSRRRAAEEASVRKSRFLAQVSHDIRNPVNTISLLAELLYRTASQSAAAGEVATIAQDIRKNTISLVDLVSDVLDLTRFDSGRIDLEESDFSLTEMLMEECRGYREMAAEKKLAFECSLPHAPVHIRTDRVKLSRVLGNLLSNALKFTHDGKVRVEVSAADSDGHAGFVQIRVCDTGVGIPEEFQDRIFDEFFQLRGNSNNRGAGLGLAICKRLVNAMGGSIGVQSAVGHGSTFSVSLPLRVMSQA